MKIEELRIGNLVKIKTSNDAAFYPVYAIDGIGLKVVLGGCRQSEGWKEEKLLKPIPITEELLLKCGFEYQMQEHCFDKSRLRLRLYESRGCSVYIGFAIAFRWQWNDANMELKYLHQLQNLFYSLTGKELEVTV